MSFKVSLSMVAALGLEVATLLCVRFAHDCLKHPCQSAIGFIISAALGFFARR